MRLAIPMTNRLGRFTAAHEFEVVAVHLHGSDPRYDLRDGDQRLLANISAVYLEPVDDAET
ncbi:MAG TPA: hypothetical protein VFB22_13930 [Candidatus Baltobacteraceae bacterium]|nr:hypothetical protein [Candidatus Baltobacteraceae bacterium]